MHRMGGSDITADMDADIRKGPLVSATTVQVLSGCKNSRDLISQLWLQSYVPNGEMLALLLYQDF